MIMEREGEKNEVERKNKEVDDDTRRAQTDNRRP